MDESMIRDSLSLIFTGNLHAKSANQNKLEITSSKYANSLDRFRVKHSDWLYARGVQAYGLGEKLTKGSYGETIVLRFYVEKKKPLSKLTFRVPKNIQMPGFGKIETDVIEVGKVKLQSLKQKLRPVSPGCNIGRIDGSSGSIGCVVKDGGGRFYIMSSAHVLSDFGTVDQGDLIVQPSALNDENVQKNIVARLSTYLNLEFHPTLNNNLYDIALAEIHEDLVSPIVSQIGVRPAGFNTQLKRGMPIKKVGSTSGLTLGQISEIDCVYATVVTLPNGQRKRAGFYNQVACTPYAYEGDSGSAVLDFNNKLVGIHMAGSSGISIFNRVKPVFDKLQLQLA